MDDSKIIEKLDKLQEDVSEIRTSIAVINERCPAHQEKTEALETIQHGRPGNGGSVGQGARIKGLEDKSDEHEKVITTIQWLPWKVVAAVGFPVFVAVILLWLGLKG